MDQEKNLEKKKVELVVSKIKGGTNSNDNGKTLALMVLELLSPIPAVFISLFILIFLALFFLFNRDETLEDITFYFILIPWIIYSGLVIYSAFYSIKNLIKNTTQNRLKLILLLVESLLILSFITVCIFDREIPYQIGSYIIDFFFKPS